ncbi:MAG: glucose-6-phosphate isomerase [Planctomycetota bacterium]|nr:glucose-6-phosphate isomerase [Planctomycetota bacterium]
MSAIRLDYTNVLAEVVGPEHGLTDEELAQMAAPSAGALASVLARRTKDLRWLDLPYQDDVLRRVTDFAASVRGRFRNVVVLGIGGSALGNTALHSALNSPYHNIAPPAGLPRLFVLDNVDPDLVGEFLDHFDPAETLFNTISKSGGTAEPMSQFLLFRQELIDRLGEEGHREHMVVTTDARTGDLREIVRREGYESFVVPDGVGGRFSVLSPVGLVPAALVGIDVEGLLEGAADMDQRCRAPELTSNPALMHAAIQWLLHTKKEKPMAVTFSYSQRLCDMADWYAQLLGESLGKRARRDGSVVHTGPTPIRATGVTDQHSQVQLYVEGPFDKWFTILAVDQPDHVVELPLAYEDLEGVSYLGGRTLEELFQAERDGTRLALTEARRPNITLSLEKIEAHAMGQLIFLLELSVALMGEHYDVNAFDQPGVEAGKVAAYALMGRAGYERRRSEIERAADVKPRVI